MKTNTAKTILEQLGTTTRRLAVMIGARAFEDFVNGVRFRFTAKARNGADQVRIILDEDDTYAVIFTRGSGIHEEMVGREFEGVQAEGIRRLFETETGLYLSLRAVA